MEEVGQVVEVVLRIDVWLMDRVFVGPGDHGRSLGDQASGADVDSFLVVWVEGVGVIGGQSRRGGGQDLHWVGVVGEGLEEMFHVLPKQGVKGDRLLVCLELGLGGQLAVLEQIDDLEEGGLLGQLLDQVSAVVKDALLATDVGHRRHALGGVGESPIDGGEAQLSSQLADVRCDLALDTLDDIEMGLLVTKSDYSVTHSGPS